MIDCVPLVGVVLVACLQSSERLVSTFRIALVGAVKG